MSRLESGITMALVNFEVTVQSSSLFDRQEIAMVLDISLSMVGTRIHQLRSVALEFLDAVAFGGPTTSVSIIPFGGTDQLYSLWQAR